MKKFKKLVAGVLIATMMLSMTAFAEEAAPAATVPQAPVYTCTIDEVNDLALLDRLLGKNHRGFVRTDYTSNAYYQFVRSQIEANIAMGNKTFQVRAFDGTVTAPVDREMANINLNIMVDVLKDHPEYAVFSEGSQYGADVTGDNDWAPPTAGAYKNTPYHSVAVLTLTSVGLTSDQFYALPYFDEDYNLISQTLWTEPVVYEKTTYSFSK